jgi:hypothetical protein
MATLSELPIAPSNHRIPGSPLRSDASPSLSLTLEPSAARRAVGEGVRSCPRAGCGRSTSPGSMIVAHQPLVAIPGQLVGMAAQKAGDLRLDSVRQQRSRAVAQNFGQRIGKSSWLAELENVSMVTAYHSFAGEVEALNTSTIRRLTPSCRHQLSPLAQCSVDFAVTHNPLIQGCGRV